MADTKFKQIGPDTGQLTNNLSFTEKTQIDTIRNTGVSISASAGRLSGSVSTRLANVNNTARSKMSIAGELASNLEAAGAVRKNSRNFLGSSVSRAVDDRKTLAAATENKRYVAPPTPRSSRQSPTEIIKTRKEKVLGVTINEYGDASYNGFQFPADLTEFAPVYLILKFKEYTRGDPFASGSVAGDAQLRLPLPENFAFTSNIRIQESDSGIYGELMNKVSPAAQGFAREGNFKQAFQQIRNDIGGSTTEESSQLISDVLKRAAFSSLSDTDAVVGGLAGQIAGAIPNPHPTVFFKGMELRQFQWNWKLVPRSKEDADELDTIIQLLRRFCIPTKSNGFLKYPYLVLPEIKPANQVIGTFKRSMVSQLSINYTGEGTSAFFVDGRPMSINLSINFMEVEHYLGEGA